jgi:hypothetical protein
MIAHYPCHEGCNRCSKANLSGTTQYASIDDAANSPQTISLTGTGTVVQVSPSALDFGDQIVGTTSDPQTATITNTGSAELRIFGVGISGPNFGDFAETTTCGSRLAPGGSCRLT